MAIACRAVVIGGSLSGLAAARVLADYFEQITLLERDTLGPGIGHRPGVPQARHAHILLPRGLSALEKIYPGLPGHLLAAGAASFDAQYAGAHLGRMRGHGIERLLGMTRPFLEWHLRQQVLGLSNVQLIDACQVMGLTASPDAGRVTGVTVRWRVPGASREDLPADLVVDASGRASQAPSWLEELGCGRPPESELRVDVGYASRLYRLRPEAPYMCRPAFLLPMPGESKRAGMALPVEDGRWMVALSGYGGDFPPINENGFREYADALPSPVVAALIRAGEPLGDIVGHRFISNLRRHYERMPETPEGFIVLGDAMCSVNPIYGQGMTMSALQALALAETLAGHETETGGLPACEGLPRRYYQRAASHLELPWLAAHGDANILM
jgi:2-polyprenyl-6-methoxyphenol hydroxylase-like FAD-dependent oxidoreductase